MKGAAGDEREPAATTRKPARAASRKGGSKERGASKDDLESRSKQELYDMAQELDIDGRSKMTKKELVQALRKSG
jgi:hypothetical protein